MMIKNKYLFSFIYNQSLNNLKFNNYLNKNFTNSIFSNNNNTRKNQKSNDENQIMISRKEIRQMLEDKDNIIKKPIKSSGPGGQHVNKTQSAILLQDKKTNISVKVGNSRDSVVNAGMAKKRLIDKLDLHYNGAESKIAKKIEKVKKQKDRNRRKRENKHNLDKNNRNDL
jgi:protein subunit release factor B